MNFSTSAMTDVDIITPIDASKAKGNVNGDGIFSCRKRSRSQMNRDVDMPKLKSNSSEDVIKLDDCDDAHENDEGDE